MFTDNYSHTFEAGDLFLGLDDDGQEIGVPTNRHAITIAGSGSGKGACVIIPNLRRWPHNTLVVDPKGENAELTYKQREELGQTVHVIDPYQRAENLPDRLRASFNPLSGIDPNSLTASTDLEVIADGLVKRSNPKNAQWDDGAVSLIAGVLGFALAAAPPAQHNLMAIREVLLNNNDDLRGIADTMASMDDFDGLIQQAGVSILTALDDPKSMASDFLSSAREHTKFLGKKAFRDVLEDSTFDLADLKTGKASVFLVLPPDYLKNDGVFLRLFVTCAINAMARGGSGKGERCLFILDEFYSLGKMENIQSSVGSMRSYGVHLWPFLQDLGQLYERYGRQGAETFFANADLHQFFGNADPLTLEHISSRLGQKTVDELELPTAPNAPVSSGMSVGRGMTALGGKSKQRATRATAGVLGGIVAIGEGLAQSSKQAGHQNKMQAYDKDRQRVMSEVGKPRFPPDEVAKLVQQRPNEVAPNSINFVTSVGVVLAKPAPYFLPDITNEKADNMNDPAKVETSRYGHLATTFFLGLIIPIGVGTILSGGDVGDFFALGLVVACVATAIDWKFKIWSS